MEYSEDQNFQPTQIWAKKTVFVRALFTKRKQLFKVIFMNLRINLKGKIPLLYEILHIFDCFCVVLLLWGLVSIRNIPWSKYYTCLLVVSFVLCFFNFYSFNLNRSWRGQKYYSEFIVILKAWGATIGCILFLFFLLMHLLYMRLISSFGLFDYSLLFFCQVWYMSFC